MDVTLLVPTCLASVSVQAFLYGIFFVLFCGSTYLMIRRQHFLNVGISRPTPVYKTPYFIAGVGLFLSVTLHWIMVIYRSFGAFLPAEPTEMGPLLYFAELGAPSYVAQVTALLVGLIICDAVIVYRLWIIWNYHYRVILFPFTTFVAGIAICIVIFLKLLQSHNTDDVVSLNDILNPWVRANLVVTISTNSSSSILIAWKLIRIRSILSAGRYGPRTASWYLSMLIEMAALYVVVTLLYLAMDLSGSEVQFIFEDNMAPISGIAFMLINVRVGLGYAVHAPTSNEDSTASNPKRSRGPATTAMSPVAVNVTQQVEYDNEYELSDLTKRDTGRFQG